MKRLLMVLVAAAVGLPARGAIFYDRSDPHAGEIALSLAVEIPKAFQPARVNAEISSLDGVLGITVHSAPSGPAMAIVLVNPAEMRGAKVSYRQVLAHEYGHVVYRQLLTDSEKREWGTLWLAECLTGRLPSAYAGTSAGEGWAEACRVRWTGGKQQKVERDFIDRVSARLSSEDVKI